MVVLDKNPLKVDKEKIKEIKICSTWKNGKEMYRNNKI